LSKKSIDVEVDAAKIAEEMKQAAQQSITEEDVKQRVEHILKVRVFDPLNIPSAMYERTTLAHGLRSDALYGHVILEYEAPGVLKSKAGFKKAIEQLKRYIMEEARFVSSYHRYFGVALDGSSMGFVRYSQRLKDWDVEKPVAVNRYTVLKLLEAIRGLARRRLDADLLIKDLGPGSIIAKNALNAFYRSIIEAKTKRAKMLFDDWRRVFSQVCAYSIEKIKGLEQVYGIKEKNINYEALLFAVHTYYSLIMKLLAAEVAVLFGGYYLKSYTKKLEGAYLRSPETLRSELKDLEEGGIFISLGIENFLEADYFAWYLDEWNDAIANVIINSVKKLSEYEPGTAELEPDVVRDLFKKLYQNLVPKKIRHDLGEFYTPDWLAELVLNEVGFTFENFQKLAKKNPRAPLDLRLLDPACGSGTFLVLAIKRIKEYSKEYFLEEEALQKITKNIVGFDLNPLAVMASRANYLLALGELVRHATQPVELPVYFADSILTEKRTTFAGAEYVLKTTVGAFSILASIVEKGVLNMSLSLIEECVLNYSVSEFKERLRREVPTLVNDEVSMLANLFIHISKLQREGKNRIWTRVLKNSFAPLFVGKFDYVVGNPPWVNWQSLPDAYRDTTKQLWINHGLFTLSGTKARYGGGKKDISMLFVYVGMDRYLLQNGLLGFVITQSLFKTRGAGEGFRRFALRGSPLKVLRVYDLVKLAPFEGAQNRTALVVIQKGKSTKYPVPYVTWLRKGKKIPTDYELDEVIQQTIRIECEALPIDPNDARSPWATLPKKSHTILKKVVGKSVYKAWEGANTGGASGVYWIKVLDKLPNGMIIAENLGDVGRKKVRILKSIFEPGLIYPLLRGRNVKRWSAKPLAYIILTQDPQKRTGIKEKRLKVRHPHTYKYLKEFEDFLKSRPLYKKYFGKSAAPFYTIYNVGRYSLSPYKVLWKEQASELTASVIGEVEDRYLDRKTVIADHKLMFVPCAKEEEAHFICAMLNSSFVQLVAKSYIVETQISTHVLEYIKVPKYDSNNELHQKLSKLSKNAHNSVTKGKEGELAKIEKEVNNIVFQLYGLTEKEIRKVKKSSCFG